jgi:hypothetical protein
MASWNRTSQGFPSAFLGVHQRLKKGRRLTQINADTSTYCPGAIPGVTCGRIAKNALAVGVAPAKDSHLRFSAFISG